MAWTAAPRGHRSGLRDRWPGWSGTGIARACPAPLVALAPDTAACAGARAAGRAALPRLDRARRPSLPSPVIHEPAPIAQYSATRVDPGVRFAAAPGAAGADWRALSGAGRGAR